MKRNISSRVTGRRRDRLVSALMQNPCAMYSIRPLVDINRVSQVRQMPIPELISILEASDDQGPLNLHDIGISDAMLALLRQHLPGLARYFCVQYCGTMPFALAVHRALGFAGIRYRLQPTTLGAEYIGRS